MPHTTRLTLALAVLVTLGSSAMAADTRMGAWLVSPYEGVLPIRCVGLNASDEDGAYLIGMVGELGVIKFAVAKPAFSLEQDQHVDAEFLIDGRRIELNKATALDTTAVGFTGKEAGRDKGSLLGELEQGSKAVVQIGGVRSTFDLDGTKAAMAALSQCDMNAAPLASTSSPTTSAGDEADSAPESWDDGADVPAADREPDADAGDTSVANGLAGALESLTGQGAPVAQFQCDITGRDMFGIPSLNGRDAPVSVTVNIRADGTALINGATLAPVQTQRNGSSVASVVYSGREVIAAIQGAVSDRAPVLGLTDEQMGAYKAVQQWGRGMTDLVMGGKDRFMAVVIEARAVAFFDLDARNQPANQTAPLCIRTL